MSISIVTNFKVNTYSPIDTRLVATNSAALSEIEFPYEGLTVFTKEQNLNYTYNGTAWQVSSNGVYGGSGSLAGNTDVNTGSVGGSQNDKSFEYILSASSSDDRAQMVTSFIRNNNGDDYETVEVKNQVKYVDNVRGVLNGPYISFNKNDSKKGIISLGTPDRNFTTTVERFRVEPDSINNNGAVVIIPSTYSLPLYFTHKMGNEIIMGYNWNGTSKLINGTSSSYISFVGGKISFFSSNYLFDTSFSEVLRVGNIQGPDSSTGEDSVTIRTDVSSNYMDTTVLQSYSFLSIPSAVRNIEHKYTKTQHLNYAELKQYGIGDQDSKTMKEALAQDNLVIITNEGNFFDFELPVDYNRNTPYQIHNIQIVRPNFDDGPDYISDVPAGTEIKIRFTYEKDPTNIGAGDYTTRIYLWQSTAHDTAIPPRKIKSSYADTNGGEYITILHNTGSSNIAETNEKIAGDIITFTKGGDGFWYVTNISREKQILKSISPTLTWYVIGSTELNYQSPLKRIKVNLDENNAAISYVWETVADSNYTQTTGAVLPDHPFKQRYDTTLFQFTDVNLAPLLRIAKDLFGNVSIKGSLQINNIPLSSLNRSYNYGISNKLYFANISNTGLRPSSSGNNLYTSWGYCEVVVRNSGASGLPFNQVSTGAVIIPGRISVDSVGRVFLQFNMSFWTSPLTGTYRLDVNVPEFSYSTN